MFCRTCESPAAVYNIEKCNGKASLAFNSSQCIWWRSPALVKCVQTKWFITAIKNPLYLLINTINRIAQRVGIQQNTTESGTTQPTRTTRHSTVRHTAAQYAKEQCDTMQHDTSQINTTWHGTTIQRAAWHNMT